MQQATVAIQGFGTAGGSTALFEEQAGVAIAAVADTEGLLYASAQGFHIPDLLSIRDPLGVIDQKRLPPGTKNRPGPEWAALPVDLLIPVAISHAIDGQRAGQVQARLIVEAANAPVVPSAEALLQRRGITVIPDFIANVGGAGLMAAALRHKVPANEAGVLGFFEGAIGGWTERLLAARPSHRTVREVARDLLARA